MAIGNDVAVSSDALEAAEGAVLVADGRRHQTPQAGQCLSALFVSLAHACSPSGPGALTAGSLIFL